MNKREFAKLLNGMREMLAHLRGEEVKGARLTAIPEPGRTVLGRQAQSDW